MSHLPQLALASNSKEFRNKLSLYFDSENDKDLKQVHELQNISQELCTRVKERGELICQLHAFNLSHDALESLKLIKQLQEHEMAKTRVLPNKVGVKVTNLDLVGVIEDEKLFGDLSDEDAVRVCSLLSLEEIFMGRLLVDIWILESCVQSILWWHKESNVIPRAFAWSKKEIFNRTDYKFLFGKEFKVNTDLTGTISELKSDWYINFRDFFMVYLPRNPPIIYNDLYEDYLNKLSASRKRAKIATKDLPIIPRNIFKHIGWTQEYLIQEEIKLRVEQEESWRLQEQKMMEEVFVKRLKEEIIGRHLPLGLATVRGFNVLPWAEELLRPNRATDRVLIADDFDIYLGQRGPLRCRFSWCKDVCVDQRFWESLLCLDPAKKDSIPVWYADGSWYKVAWKDVDQVFMPINETDSHRCLAQLDIRSGVVTFYDSGITYDHEWRDWYITLRECLQSFMRMVNEDFQFTPLNSYLQLSCLSPIDTSEGYEKILGDDGFLAKTFVLVSFDLINHHFQVFEIPQQLRDVLPSPFHISQLRSSVVLLGTFTVGEIVLLCGWDLAVDGASVTSFSMLFSIPTIHSVKLIGFTNNDAPIVKVDELGYQLAHTLQVYDHVSEEFQGVCMEEDGGSIYIGPYKESLILLNHPDHSLCILGKLPEGGVFGDCGIWVCIFLYRLSHGISLDVGNPIQTALAYREQMAKFF
ncbi:phospholipase-like protein [Tanacetum coccineum]